MNLLKVLHDIYSTLYRQMHHSLIGWGILACVCVVVGRELNLPQLGMVSHKGITR